MAHETPDAASRAACGVGARDALGAAAGALVLVGLAAYLMLHFAAPQSALTWSYAHLDRAPWRVACAALGVLMLPPLVAVLWRLPPGRRALSNRLSRQTIALAAVALAAWVAIGGALPAPASNFDALVMVRAMEGERDVARWTNTQWLFRHLVALARPYLDARSVLVLLDSLAAGLGLLGIAAAVRELVTTRAEAIALFALVATSFGVLQIAVGYVDIYPVALFFTGMWLALALRTIRRGLHPVFPAMLLGAAPFFYIGLVLLWPSALAIAWAEVRRADAASHRRARARLGVAAAGAIGTAALSTLPAYGRIAAWRDFLADASRDSAANAGLQLGTNLLPLDVLFSAQHALEVLHGLLLVDALGPLFLLGPGLWVCARTPLRDWRRWDPRALLLCLLVAPSLLYSTVMDPVYGPYADWDLWSFGAGLSALLGGWAFIVWGRAHARVFPLLLGLALAASTTHLLARLHAIPFERDQHMRESPVHLLPEADRAEAARRNAGARAR